MRSKGCRRPLLSSPGGQEEDGGQEEGSGGALCIYTGGQDTPGRYMVSSCRRKPRVRNSGVTPIPPGKRGVGGVTAPIPSGIGVVPSPHSP